VKTIEFHSRLHAGSWFDAAACRTERDDSIKAEPMLFNCSIDAAYRLGGPLTRSFLEGMPEAWRQAQAVVDSRSHMLKPGWLPCIGGYHLDDVPRHSKHGQPMFEDPPYRSRHIMGLVGGDICPTVFATGRITLPIPEPPAVTYGVWHPLVAAAVADGLLQAERVESGRYYEFDDRALHRGTKAIGSGWRWFIRVSRDTSRTSRLTNEVRTQTQVYLDTEAGW
jgi:hypothetical protein